MTDEEMSTIVRRFTLQDLLLVEIVSALRDSVNFREREWLERLSKIKERLETRKEHGDDITELNELLERLMN